MFKVIMIFLVLFFLTACKPTYKTAAEIEKGPLIFSVMGDVPRSASEDTLLQKQIAAHNVYSKSEFMLHVGDIKTGGEPCNEDVYIKVADYLKALNVPTFIVPGDNEWNDCTDPVQAWSFWVKHFLKFQNNWNQNYKIAYQKEHAENIAWITKDVLMIGINMVGGRVFDQEIWNKLLEIDADWVEEQVKEKGEQVKAMVVFAQAKPRDDKHILFMNRFRKLVKEFQKPVLYLHGDGHIWLYDNPWLEENMIRVQVDQGGIALPLEVLITFEGDSIFHFERNPYPLTSK